MLQNNGAYKYVHMLENRFDVKCKYLEYFIILTGQDYRFYKAKSGKIKEIMDDAGRDLIESRLPSLIFLELFLSV